MFLSRCGSTFVLFVATIALLAACHSGIYHTVEPGQTLFRISRTYDVDSNYLARINNISDPTQLRVGTRLYIPGADRHRTVAVVTPKPSASAPTRSPVSAPRSAPPPVPAPLKSQPSSPPGPSATAAAPTVAPHQKLHWPLRGEIVRQFSATAEAGSGRGIEIAARSGSDVHAAEAGRVIYSGDGVSGYGFLVVLQHDNQLFTVYGFNQRTLVNQGAFVSRGDRIALSGTPPSGGEPRLHFEVRQGKEPVNPHLYLP